MPLLGSKLHSPRLRPERVARAHLLQRLDSGLSGVLTLVSAPAGFGKTTLIAEWLSDCPRPSTWLSLDEQDSDPFRFLSYLTGALQLIEDEAGQGILAAMHGLSRPPAPIALMPGLVDEIGAIPEAFILVLDDYHLISSQSIHDAVAFLVDHQPENMHLVIVTRADPPLDLGRLRARGQLTELRQVDLRFTPSETGQLLQQALGAPLPPAQIDALTEQTEGWVAGLQMAGLALQERARLAGVEPGDAGEFVAGFRGTQRHVMDFLVEEVLSRQPPDVLDFLLRTSILERLCGSLCDAVARGVPDGAGRLESSTPAAPHGQQMLERLERANLFLIPLDDRREWYRYHRLFADLLQQRLHTPAGEGWSLAAEIPELHRRASLWFERHAMSAEAIAHALAAGDSERAAGLIELAAPQAWKQGELESLLRWVNALPEVALAAHPAVALYAATAQLILPGLLSQAETLITLAVQNDPGRHLDGEVATLRSILAIHRVEIEEGLAQAERAVELLPPSSVFRGLATRSLSALQLLKGDPVAATLALEQDVAASALRGDRLGESAGLRRLGSLALYRGELRKAHALYQRALDLSRDAKGRLWPVAGRVLVHLGELALEWNDLERAESHCREALRLSSQIMPGWNSAAQVVLARLLQARSDSAGAQQALEAARVLARATETLMDDTYLELAAARLAVQQRKMDLAERWASQWTAAPGKAAPRPGQDVDGLIRMRVFLETGQLTLAGLRLAQGRPDEALQALAEPTGPAPDASSWGSQVERLALRALALQAKGDLEAALGDLASALALGEPEGFTRTFVNEGEPMRQLLRQAARRGPYAQYAARLLSAFDVSRPAISAALSPPDAPERLAEPLTEREAEVLRLLQTSLTIPEIAQQMNVAPSTVRTFVKNVYGKLGVHRRLDALEQARGMGLISA